MDTSDPSKSSLFFSGSLHVALIGDIDACVIVNSTRIYAHLQVFLGGTTISMSGLVAASYGKATDFSFEVSFEISAEGGIIHSLLKTMTKDFDDFKAKLEVGAKIAKAALQSGIDDVETAKHKVEVARQKIDSGFGALEDDVSSAQRSLDSLQSSCVNYDKWCHW